MKDYAKQFDKKEYSFIGWIIAVILILGFLYLMGQIGYLPSDCVGGVCQ